MSEAYPSCKRSVNIPFKKLFSSSCFSVDEIRINKGKTGQLLERLCGLELTSNRKAFEDGKLQTSEIKDRLHKLITWFINRDLAVH